MRTGLPRQDVTMADLAAQARTERRRGSVPWLVLAFHLVAGAVAACVLWSMSYPGSNFLVLAASAVGSLVMAGIWLGGTIFVAARTVRRWRWFVIGPVIGVLTVALLAIGAPLQLRWAASRDAFATVVAGHPIPPAGSKWTNLPVPEQLGSYRIIGADWVPGGAVFYEAHGNFFDDAGFAYLPAGPTAELNTGWFEGPRFRQLGGGWYSWTASW
ncbi:hypothetical protein ABT297_39500 [Dactylosporangium sp. NPDC000555]|uniref:hypothetical protein n=1 Tax=Dactylosporangium sp. NPDC000555 TaxID=3154260 RepID=UPI00332E73DE